MGKYVLNVNKMVLIWWYINIYINKYKNKYRNNYLLFILGYCWFYKILGCIDKLLYSVSVWCVIEGMIFKKCLNVWVGIILVDLMILKVN